jgi:hypothetical protein
MRKIVVLLAAIGMAAALGACGSSSSKSTSSTTVHVAIPVGTNPSKSAKMVCQPEAQDDVAGSLGVKTTQVTAPTWADHVYSCKYVYPNGSFTLSVKELANKSQTDAYFAQLQHTLGQSTATAPDLGQGAFTTPNGSLVVRKDFKVLTVDVSGLPAQFGAPPQARSSVALSIGTVVMGCWTGA